ncbi:MAG: integrin alpha, partial [Ignavibacteria bacterium]|nr:integrin alpha [Ignavibacteria bacterium]
MKKLYLLKCIAIIFVMHFSFAEKAEANWQKPEKSSIAESKEKVSQRNSENSKTDSLPAGVTNDWLNSLTDENGKRIKTEDPEGDAIQQRNFNGQTAGDNYGVNVSSAGDLNGDGFDDIIIGAPDNDAGGTDAGKVYIYYGGTIINNIVDVVIIGEAAGDRLGVAVSGAGDVNGDGYSDVIVGAGGYNSNTGKANIYFGGPVMNNIPDVTFTGENINDGFGYAVSTADDVNGDGYSDVIIGAQSYNSSAGKTYIYFGGAVMNNVEDVIMNGETANDFFGITVSRAGDVNGDGYSDVIAGAYSYGSNTGRAYIFFGGTAMDGIAEVILNGETAGDYFGRSVSAAGDVNGDGFSDVITGAYGYDSFRGRAYLYYGGAAMNEIADVILTGEVANNLFGFSVSGAGDVNGDGYSDVITGACGFNSNTGRAYIYYGGNAMNNIADVVLNGESIGNYFGFSVSSTGDVNSDGYSDLIVGADRYNSNTGKAYIFFGGASMNNTPDISMNGEFANDNFGISVSAAGDLNGDGLSDIVVGAYGNSSFKGRSYIYLSSSPGIKPGLISVKDVPFDQGGKVNLKWSRSGYDVNGVNRITSYSVSRSYPPVGGNFAWSTVAEVTAETYTFYSFTDITPYDSSSGNSGTFFYRIKAKTSSAQEFWYSNILSGRSIDNIAPLMVSPFTATAVSGNVRLNWRRNYAPDLLNYILYRSTSPVIDPNTEPVFATTSDSTYLDTSPLSGVYYYFIVAQDIHNNKSTVAVALNPNLINLNMTMFIEGFYNSGTNLMVSDTVNIYLRNAVSPFAFVDSAKSVVSSAGIVSAVFANAPTGTYYIVIKHRNSIVTWSKAGGESLVKGISSNYNLSSSVSQAFGNN